MKVLLMTVSDAVSDKIRHECGSTCLLLPLEVATPITFGEAKGVRIIPPENRINVNEYTRAG